MSLYKQCSKATQDLIENPPKGNGGVFTEIDVVQRASRSDWSQAAYKEALRHAGAIVGDFYRRRKLCRFGPVILDDGTKDYARIASKIVYASLEGPKVWETPNGVFPALLVENDDFGRQGRRHGTNRDDTEIWGAQTDDEVASEELVNQLKGELQEREDRLRSLEEELHRCKQQQGDDVQETLQDVVQRLESLEGALSK